MNKHKSAVMVMMYVQSTLKR